MQSLCADLVLTDTNVITICDAAPRAEAIAIRGDIILATGSAAEIAPLIGDDTEVLALHGKSVVPGFIDSHTHMVSMGNFLFSPKRINAAAELYPSIRDLQRSIRTEADGTPEGEWVGGVNLDPNGLEEKRWPTRYELDEGAMHHPVVIYLRGFHACVANSMALERAGINRDTPDPEGGVIERDAETGEPTGVLRDVSSIREVLPIPKLEDFKEGLGLANDLYLQLGITSQGDAGAFPNRPEAYRAYQEAVAEGRLKVRTYLMIREAFYREMDLGLRTGFGNNRLRLGAVKIFVDGSIQAFTCAFDEPYVTRDTRGMEGLQYSVDELNALVEEVHALGYQVAMHAQGDCGIRIAVDAIEQAMRKHPRPDPRHRIEHTLCPTLDDLKRMKELGIIPNFYVFHPWFWGDQHINNFIGAERAARMTPVKTALKLGLRPCAHSDCPVCTPNDPVWPSNPLWGMACATTRKTRSGIDNGPEERISPEEALCMYTLNGAYATFEENIKGSIEPGKLADLVVLGDDPLAVDTWEIRNIPVERTIIGGETVFLRDA
ncbi:MAG: amidohydrolase [SAR324 cluster bacterium]|nr:amidohydrolase [SAR324 cluster bacterium]